MIHKMDDDDDDIVIRKIVFMMSEEANISKTNFEYYSISISFFNFFDIVLLMKNGQDTLISYPFV